MQPLTSIYNKIKELSVRKLYSYCVANYLVDMNSIFIIVKKILWLKKEVRIASQQLNPSLLCDRQGYSPLYILPRMLLIINGFKVYLTALKPLSDI